MSIGLSEETLAVESELGEATRKAEQERIDQLMAEQQAEIDAALAEGRDPIAEKKAAKADRKPVVVPEKDVKEVNDVLGDAGAVEITGQAKDDLLGALLQPRKDAPVKEIKVPKKADKKADKKAKGKKGDGDGKADQ